MTTSFPIDVDAIGTDGETEIRVYIARAVATRLGGVPGASFLDVGPGYAWLSPESTATAARALAEIAGLTIAEPTPEPLAPWEAALLAETPAPTIPEPDPTFYSFEENDVAIVLSAPVSCSGEEDSPHAAGTVVQILNPTPDSDGDLYAVSVVGRTYGYVEHSALAPLQPRDVVVEPAPEPEPEPEPVPEPAFALGDRVVVTVSDYGTSVPVGSTGEIVKVHGPDLFGVRIDDGPTYSPANGWTFRTDELAPEPEPEPVVHPVGTYGRVAAGAFTGYRAQPGDVVKITRDGLDFDDEYGVEIVVGEHSGTSSYVNVTDFAPLTPATENPPVGSRVLILASTYIGPTRQPGALGTVVAWRGDVSLLSAERSVRPVRVALDADADSTRRNPYGWSFALDAVAVLSTPAPEPEPEPETPTLAPGDRVVVSDTPTCCDGSDGVALAYAGTTRTISSGPDSDGDYSFEEGGHASADSLTLAPAPEPEPETPTFAEGNVVAVSCGWEACRGGFARITGRTATGSSWRTAPLGRDDLVRPHADDQLRHLDGLVAEVTEDYPWFADVKTGDRVRIVDGVVRRENGADYARTTTRLDTDGTPLGHPDRRWSIPLSALKPAA